MTSLTVGNGGSIAGNAFWGNSLRNLVLGEGINIGVDTFSLFAYYDYLCNSRRAGTYDNTVTYTAITEGDYQFIKTRYGAVITRYTGNEGSRLQIPRQLGGVAVKGIGGLSNYSGITGAFANKSVSRMQLPDGLVFIGDGAFGGNQLTSVTVPDSVTFIGNQAFSGNQLTSVTIPNSVTTIGEDAFNENRITSVTIGNGVTTIGDSAFRENRLTSVTIPAGVTSIGANAFSLNQLTSITLPDGVTSIGSYAFGRGNITYSGAGTYTFSDDDRGWDGTWTKR